MSYHPDTYEYRRVEPHTAGGITYGSHMIIRTFGVPLSTEERAKQWAGGWPDLHAAVETFAMDAALIVRRANVRLNRVGKKARRKINRAVPDVYGIGPGMVLNQIFAANRRALIDLLTQTNEIMNDMEWVGEEPAIIQIGVSHNTWRKFNEGKPVSRDTVGRNK